MNVLPNQVLCVMDLQQWGHHNCFRFDDFQVSQSGTESGPELTLERVSEQKPDIVLVDLGLVGSWARGGGWEFIRQIRVASPATRIIAALRPEHLDSVPTAATQGLIDYFVAMPMNSREVRACFTLARFAAFDLRVQQLKRSQGSRS